MINFFGVLLAGIITILTIIRSPIYWIVILLVFIQYKRINKMEKKILGINRESIYITMLKVALLGLLGGLIGSLAIVMLGISIDANDFKYIFILAIILMLIHPRFICFSYSGGIISILALTIGYPRVNVSSIMAIVAILHLIESFLILIDGDSLKLPIYIERDNMIVGGFNLMRFWPIPFIVLVLVAQPNSGIGLKPSEWWPIFKSPNSSLTYSSLAYLMAGIIAVLGYGDTAVTDYPRNKTKASFKNLLLFSCVLLTLAIASTYIKELKIIAALFSPIAHEVIIQYGRKKEREGKPVFIPPRRGIKILDTLPKGWAAKIGLKPGDIILSLNGFYVNSKEEVNSILYYRPKYILIDYLNTEGSIVTKELRNNKNGIKSLGILSIPRNPQYSFVAREIRSPILTIIDKVKKS